MLLTGWVLPQVILFGPSLAGTKILLPLDLLAYGAYYLPAVPPYQSVRPHSLVVSDLVLSYEFSRRFAAAEFRAGRVPLWDPYLFAGTPFAHFGKYSPFNLVYYAFPRPVTLAWIQLFKSLVAGLGAYLFFRRALAVGFWPAAVGAWCYPLTGFYVLWQGYPLTFVTAWFPYLLLATDRAVRRSGGWGGPALAVATCLVLVSGHLALAGLALLASGLYALWCLTDAYVAKPGPTRIALAVALTAGAWGLGFLISAPYVLPLVEYARTGARMNQRFAGEEERPPGGLWALPQTILPNVYGSLESDFVYTAPGMQIESAGGAYAGLLATLLVAPLAWLSRRHRSLNVFWVVLAVISLAWVLDLPGLVWVLRRPGLNMLSSNRFVFAASFALLCLAVVGLEVLGREVPRRWWFALPAAVLLVLGGWCWLRWGHPPEEAALLKESTPLKHFVPGFTRLNVARQRYERMYLEGGVLCVLGLAGWAWLAAGKGPRPWARAAVGGLLVGELLWFGSGLNAQCDPSLYYPDLPVLRELAQKPPGRVLGCLCLPSNLNELYGLRDVRGYDGVDPLRLVEVLDLARDPKLQGPPYDRTGWYWPVLELPPDGRLRVPGVLSMLNVRYFIFRGNRPAHARPLLAQDDYWVLENPSALPRVYVPGRVVTADDHQALGLMARRDFDPRRVAYVNRDVGLSRECRGSVKIVDEIPTRVTVSADMQTPGLLVLADQWNGGWRAYLDGRPAPCLRVNHVLRGVQLPAGRGTVVFSYEPASLTWGGRLLLLGLGALATWAAGLWFATRKSRRALHPAKA